MEQTVWGIHTYNDNLFLKENIIAIGWGELGNLSLIESTRDAFKAAYETAYPNFQENGTPR